MTGGHSGSDNFGTQTTYIFDAALNSWTRAADMGNGRWYPTNTTLATGEVLTISGGDTAGMRNASGGLAGTAAGARSRAR